MSHGELHTARRRLPAIGRRLTAAGGRLAVVVCVVVLVLSTLPGGVVASEPPTASFTYTPSTPHPDETITFDASGSSDPDGDIVDYDWYVGGGRYADADGETVTWTFDEGGSHTITLEVEDERGNVDRYQETVTVENPAPEADVDVTPASPAPDETVHFTASGSTDADGRIVDYDWYVGSDDYTDGDGENFETSFDTAGTYTVSLEVEDNGGKTDRVSETIVVENAAPKPSFSVSPATPHPDDEVTFDASESTDEDGRIVDYDWYVGSDDYTDGDGQTFTHTFDEGGVYDVRLVVTDNGDVTREVEQAVNVTNPAPVPSFTTRSSPDGLDVTFDASESTDEDGRIVDYDWYVGDDYRIGSEQTFTYEFDEKGTYEVRLVVTDNGDVTRELTRDVAVSQRPTAAVDYAGRALPVGHTVELSAVDSVDPDGNLTSYVWTLPDGTTKHGETVTTAVAETGEHDLTLTVTDETGNSHTVTRTVVAKEAPTVAVTWSPDTPRDDLDVTFGVNASKPVETASWDFDGDGAFDDATGEVAVHAFEDTGKKQVGVRVVSTDGVATTHTDVVPVQQSAAFELTSVKTDVAEGETAVVTFSASNLVRDTPMDVKLALDLPDSGASITSVDGASAAGPGETTFVTVEPGQKEEVRVRIQFTEAGSYEIGGDAVYYFGDDSSADRRTETVDTIAVTATGDEASSESPASSTQSEGLEIPGFGIRDVGIGVVALLVVGTILRRL
ncbi:PKD domain-containing protein [Halogeometricum limi]|uniref:PKD domain-containing protein n=1 Tax=Halogeometricum limi TaxID=555875 RepID=UPI001586FD6A|nr:PKD domain-containing protein [Halogeometricum limi]